MDVLCIYIYVMYGIIYCVYAYTDMHMYLEAEQLQKGEEEGSIIFRLIFIIKWWLCTRGIAKIIYMYIYVDIYI